MHAFIEDHLIVFDPFGLTRVELSSGRVKHNKKVVGEFMVQNGSLLVAHSHVSNNRFAMTVPQLKVVPVDAWNYQLTYETSIGVTPEGLPFEAQRRALAIYSLGGDQLHDVELEPKQLSGTLELGPAWPVAQTRWTAMATMGRDGTFVIYGDGEVLGGKLAAGKHPTIDHPWVIAAPRTQGVVRMRAGEFGAFVSAYHPAQGKAYCALIGRGKATSVVVECLAPVDFDGTRIAYQASLGEVHRRRFDGELERFELPKPERGTVMADGDRLWFVTADHERFRDLVNDDVIDRELPAAERPNRTKVLAFVEGFRGAANLANASIQVAALRPPAYGMGPRPEWAWNEGDQSVLRTAIIGNLLARSYTDSDLSAGSYSPPMHLAPVREADVDRLLATLVAHDLDLLAGVTMLETALEDHWGPRRGKQQPLFERAAGSKLLAAVLAAIRRGPPPEITTKSVIAAIDPNTDNWRVGTHSHALKATAYLLLETLGADALPILLDWLFDRPSRMVESNAHTMAAIAAAMIVAFPETKARFDERLAAAIAGTDQDAARRATALRQSIDFELR